MSPTQRSLQQLKRLGFAAAVVEKWNPHARIRQDCFGIDILALRPQEMLAVQTTTGANHAQRRAKLVGSGCRDLWRSAGASVEIWSWTKAGRRGKRKSWQLRREAL